MSNVSKIDLREVDLNLLVVLGVLMQERSVQRAARRLRLGPSAVSMALGRLRVLLDDPLFLRSGSAMDPTPRAIEVHARIAPALEAVGEAIARQAAFDPARAQRILRLGCSDDFEVVVVPALLEALALRAPGVRLVARACDFRVLTRLLDEREIDLALVGAPLPVDRRHGYEVLYEERLAVVVDRKQLGMRGPLTKKQFLASPHVLQSASGVLHARLDERLGELGLRRDVVAAVAHFASLPFLLRRMKAVANMPALAARHLAEAVGLAVSPLPVPSPTFDVVLAWPAQTAQDPFVVWARELVRETVTALRAPATRRH